MTNTIRAVKSTLNFFLAMLELTISVVLAIKVFQADVASESGLAGYILSFFRIMNDGAEGLISFGDESIEQISFLVVILVFMIFSQALFLAIPRIIERDRQSSPRDKGRQYAMYKKRRFQKNRFFKKQNRYQQDYFF